MGDTASANDAGFVERTRIGAARETLRSALTTTTGTAAVGLPDAAGRVLAESITAPRNVPDFPRAAMDGYAVRAADTFGAESRAPATLDLGEEPGRERTTWVHTGSPVPEPADAVVKAEHATEVEGRVEITTAAAVGGNVSAVGEDLEAGQHLFDPGHRLRPSDLGLLRSVEIESVTVRDRPTVAVVPTGEEIVDSDPDPGEAIETNGIVLTGSIERWGGEARLEDVVTDDRDALAAAVEANLDADVVVTTGGSSVGKRDLLPDVIVSRGDLLVHGVALKPGHPVAIGLVEETPVLALPGYPVACIVNAWQFLRPLLSWLQGAEPDDPAQIEATLDRKVHSKPGIRTCVRVDVEDGEDGPRAVPVQESGASILSSVALADGWVQVPEAVEGYDAGASVTVEFWEAHP